MEAHSPFHLEQDHQQCKLLCIILHRSDEFLVGEDHQVTSKLEVDRDSHKEAWDQVISALGSLQVLEVQEVTFPEVSGFVDITSQENVDEQIVVSAMMSIVRSVDSGSRDSVQKENSVNSFTHSHQSTQTHSLTPCLVSNSVRMVPLDLGHHHQVSPSMVTSSPTFKIQEVVIDLASIHLGIDSLMQSNDPHKDPLLVVLSVETGSHPSVCQDVDSVLVSVLADHWLEPPPVFQHLDLVLGSNYDHRLCSQRYRPVDLQTRCTWKLERTRFDSVKHGMHASLELPMLGEEAMALPPKGSLERLTS